MTMTMMRIMMTFRLKYINIFQCLVSVMGNNESFNSIFGCVWELACNSGPCSTALCRTRRRSEVKRGLPKSATCEISCSTILGLQDVFHALAYPGGGVASLSNFITAPHVRTCPSVRLPCTHTHTYIYIYYRIYVCVPCKDIYTKLLYLSTLMYRYWLIYISYTYIVCKLTELLWSCQLNFREVIYTL